MGKHFTGILITLIVILIAIGGAHYLLDKLLGDDVGYGYVFLFFSLFSLGLLFLSVRYSIKKIKYIQRGQVVAAAAINNVNQIIVPGVFGLVIGLLTIFYTHNYFESQFSLRNELLVNKKGKKIDIPINMVTIRMIGDSTVSHHSNYSLFDGGDLSYSPLFILTAQWKDSINLNSYEFASSQWTYDPSLFLEDRKSITVYVDPENTYSYYVDDSFLPDAQWKRYDTEEMRQELIEKGKGKRITVPINRVVVDHHHVNTERPSNKKNSRIYCCYVIMAAWKNPASGEMIPFKTEHFAENDPAEELAKQRQITVYIDPDDVWRYYVDVSFMDN